MFGAIQNTFSMLKLNHAVAWLYIWKAVISKLKLNSIVVIFGSENTIIKCQPV